VCWARAKHKQATGKISNMFIFSQGRRQKIFQEGGQRKKRPKKTKNSTIKPLWEEGNAKKTDK